MRFTQFLMPHGRRRSMIVDRPPEIERKAAALVAAGYKLEAEVLSNGEVSVTVEYPRLDPRADDGPIAIETCPNGPAVPDAIDKMITTAHERAFGGSDGDTGRND